MPRGGSCRPRGGRRGASTWGRVLGGGGPLAPSVLIRGRCARFPRWLWGVENAGRESQAFPAAWWGQYLIVEGERCRLPALSLVVPLHCPPGVPVLEDVYFCGGQDWVHCLPADKLDRADHMVGL